MLDHKENHKCVVLLILYAFSEIWALCVYDSVSVFFYSFVFKILVIDATFTINHFIKYVIFSPPYSL